MTNKKRQKLRILTSIFCCCIIFPASVCIGQQLYPASRSLENQKKSMPSGERSVPIVLPENTKSFKIDASIMEMDLRNNVIVVAEKFIKIPTYKDENGVTRYKVNLINDRGDKLVIADFKPGESVIVEGYRLATGERTAVSMQLLPQRP